MSDRSDALRWCQDVDNRLNDLAALARRQSPELRQRMVNNIIFAQQNVGGLRYMIDLEVNDR